MDIAHCLSVWREHVSPRVREKAKAYTSLAIQEALRMLQEMREKGDGFCGHAVIGAWHKGSETGVMECLFNDPVCGAYRKS
jgi:hypothetical protein